MRIPTPLYALGAAAAMTFLAGCSSGTSSVAPVAGTAGNQSTARVPMNVTGMRVPMAVAPSIQSLMHPGQPGSVHEFMSPDASGVTPTLYVSQFFSSDILVYKQAGTNQSPIGTITRGVLNPQGMFVTPNNWIYVANTGNSNVLVFVKGETHAFQTLNDPGQFPVDVAVDTDGTVFATNIFDTGGGPGSVTVWAPGHTNPTGSLAVPNNAKVLFCALDKFHNLYVNYIDATSGVGAMVKFRHGKGTAQLTNVATSFPGGLEFDQLGRLAGLDQIAGTVNAYRLPSGSPVFSFNSAGDPLAIAFTKSRSFVYISDAQNGPVYQYVWKNGSLVDTISKGLSSSSQAFGVAADPGAPL